MGQTCSPRLKTLPPDKKWGLLVAAVILGVVLYGQINEVISLNHGLSRIADRFSEANALRAGQKFVECGFLIDWGLPDIDYGNLFPGEGVQGDPWYKPTYERLPCKPHWVYTHYPPGPDLMAGLSTYIFGLGNVGYYRIWPMLLGLVCMFYFAWRLVDIFGGARGASALLACAMVPMFSNMMHGLHYQGYAFALLLAQWAILLDFFTPEAEHDKMRPIGLALLGFLQGWLSFDYFFLVAFSAAPFWFWQWGKGAPASKKRLLIALSLSFSGFLLAHMLHFGQVILHWGGLEGAIKDYYESAQWRMSGEFWDKPATLILVFRNYIGVLIDPRYFGHMLVIAFGLALLTFCCPRVRYLDLNRRLPWRLGWGLNIKMISALLAAGLVSILWLIVMKQHALYHTHFLPRHFMLVYFFSVLTILHGLHLEKKPEADRLSNE